MSVQTEITRINTAKSDIATAITNKGVAVPSGTKLDGMAALIDGIETGGGTTIGASYNADGTQNLIIKDDGSVIEIPDPNPVLLWTNASPTSAFAAQTVAVNGTGYSGYLVEVGGVRNETSNSGSLNITFVPMNSAYKAVSSQSYLNSSEANPFYYMRMVTSATENGITFSTGSYGKPATGSMAGTNYAIPTRIWGVKFTL